MTLMRMFYCVAWIQDPMELAHSLHDPGLLLRHKHDGGVEGGGVLPPGRHHPARHAQGGRELVLAQHGAAKLGNTTE